MRIDPLPRTTGISISTHPNGYVATLANVRLHDGTNPATAVYAAVREADRAAAKLARQYGYRAV